MVDTSIKEKIKKLLRVAENDAATEGEIDNAVRAARALMLKHSIEVGDVKEKESDGYTSHYAFVGAKSLLLGEAAGSVRKQANRDVCAAIRHP